MVDFSQLVIVSLWYVEMCCQSDVIWSDFSERFDISLSFDDFDLRSDDLLFGDCGGFFGLNIDDSVI